MSSPNGDEEAKGSDGADPAPKTEPCQLHLKLPATTELRDGLKFDGVEVRVIHKRPRPPSTTDGDEGGENEGPAVRLVGTANVGLSSFLEPTAGGSLVLHERVALELEPGWGGDSLPEVVVSLELNPEGVLGELRLDSTSAVYETGVE